MSSSKVVLWGEYEKKKEINEIKEQKGKEKEEQREREGEGKGTQTGTGTAAGKGTLRKPSPEHNLSDDEEMTNDKEGIVRTILGLPSSTFKSQQRDEPDLARNEKRSIAEDLFDKRPDAFLAKFGKHLRPKQLDYFARFAEKDDEVRHRLRRLRTLGDRVGRRNRRLRAIGRMEAEGGDEGYFGLEAMKERKPALFHQMVGKHCKKEAGGDTEEPVDQTDCRLSSIILNHIDLDRDRERKKECERDEEEFDEEEEEEESEKIEETDSKAQLLSEFTRVMKESFLDGGDATFFDYAKVDEDSDLDDLEAMDRDEEERYFDED
jgi:hypothetical protein